MPKLQPSLTGDNYTQAEKDQMWLLINHRCECPECSALNSMLHGPRGGLNVNIKCKYCHMVFCLSDLQGFGAYPVRDDTPTQEQLQANAKHFFEDHLLPDNNKEGQS